MALAVRFLMVDFYNYYRAKMSDIIHKHRILVYGTSRKAVVASLQPGDGCRHNEYRQPNIRLRHGRIHQDC